MSTQAPAAKIVHASVAYSNVTAEAWYYHDNKRYNTVVIEVKMGSQVIGTFQVRTPR